MISNRVFCQPTSYLRAAIIVTLLSIAFTAHAQWPQVNEFLNSDGGEFDFYGDAVAVDGDVAVIGAWLTDDDGESSGSVEVYRYNGETDDWKFEQKLAASDASAGAHFGSSVAVSGDVIVAGAQREGENGLNAGAAYVFRYDGSSWMEEQKLTTSDIAANDWLGAEVSLSGDVIFVCANRKNSFEGAAYIFRYNGALWLEEQKLTASDGETDDWFGFSVSVWGDVAVAGAYAADNGVISSGAAYVYRYDGTAWNEEQKLNASDGEANDSFGQRVSVWGDVICVGSPSHSHGAFNNAGAVYVYRYNGTNWTEEQEIVPSNPEEFMFLGRSISISGDAVLIGSLRDNDSGVAAGSVYLFRYNGSVWSEEEEFNFPQTLYEDRFGDSVSLSGDVALIGAQYTGAMTQGTGAAYIYRFTGPLDHSEEQKITASNGMANDAFGTGVAIAGDVAVVGAPDEIDNLLGQAYVYRYNGDTNLWDEEQILSASDEANDDSFGASVGVFGDTAIIGARNDDDDGSSSGSAYIYRYNGSTDNWDEEQKLTASDAAALDNFGMSVSIWGGTALVGSPFINVSGMGDSGAAYIYRYNGTIDSWSEEQKLVASDFAAGDFFGQSVAIHGDVAVIGAPDRSGTAVLAGAVYVFRFHEGINQWVEEAKLVASDGMDSDAFGISVAISGGVILVGAYQADEAASDAGAAYIFRYDHSTNLWIEEKKLLAPPASANDLFGISTAISGDVALVGSWLAESGDGAADFFRYNGTDWVHEQTALDFVASGGNVIQISLGLSGGTAILGDPSTNSNTGAAHIFRADSYANSPPVSDPGFQYFVECRDAADGSTTIQLDGSASFDPNKDPITFNWIPPTGGGTVDDNTIPMPTLDVTGIGPGNDVLVVLDVSDGTIVTRNAAQVFITDTMAPSLVLTGDLIIELEQDQPFVEPGFTADDTCDGDISSSVAVTGALDTGTLGSYELTYTVMDRSGNQAQATRTVNILPKPTDINEDGTVDSVDIQTVINIVLGIFGGTADANNDGMTNSVDIQLVINEVLGV